VARGPDSLRAYAPWGTAIELIRSEGASDMIFANVSLLHAATDMNGFFEGDCDAQSATNLQSAAVHFFATANVTVRNVTLAHVGGIGIWPDQGCANIVMAGLHVHDTGASAVRMGTSAEVPEVNTTVGVELLDSWLHDGGKVYIHAPGVVLQYAEHSMVSHNEIFDFDYSGISMGWWPPDHNGGVEVSYNHLHHLGRGQLSDMGCIYSLGSFAGAQGATPTRMANNVCHNVSVYDYGGRTLELWKDVMRVGPSDLNFTPQHFYQATLTRC
jgi:hypothetical protein